MFWKKQNMLIGILLFGMKHLHELLDIWSMIKVLVELLVISTLMDSLRSFENTTFIQ